MKIRSRIALVAIGVTLPQLVGLWWWDASSRHEAAGRVLQSMAERVVRSPGAQEACLADAQSWADGLDPRRHRGRHERGGPPAGPPLGPPQGPPDGPPRGMPEGGPPPPPHGAPFRGPPPNGPRVLPPEVVVGGDPTGLVVGQAQSIESTVWSNQIEVALRTGWGGDCEVVRVRGTTVPGFLGSVLPATPIWLAPILLVATVMWLAVAPPVNRIRRLTERIRAGERRVASGGDDEIAELAQAFQDAAVALEQREAALQTFVSNTAHDMRIPLTVLRGHLVAMEQGPDAVALQQAVSEVHYLSALLDDLAAQARMEAPEPHQPFDLAPLIERVVARHAPIARRKGVALHHGVPENPIQVVGDLTLVEQALSNLVYNGIHYNRAGGNVAITLDASDGRFEATVVDDGPGVPPDELARLTERGYRGTDARGRDLRGSGLGLSIVERVARAHHWTFGLENLDDGGLQARLEGPTWDPTQGSDLLPNPSAARIGRVAGAEEHGPEHR